MKARTAAANQFHSICDTTAEVIRGQLRGLSTPRATIGLWSAGILHDSIALIALIAGPLGRSRFALTPLETEALFSLVMSVGLAVAWLLLFADDGATRAG